MQPHGVECLGGTLKLKPLVFKDMRIFWAKNLIFLAAASVLPAGAGAQVQSRAFRAMLQTLLSHDVPETTVPKAAAEAGVVWLDARAWREYEVSHLAGAAFVGYDDFDLSRVAAVPKNARVVVYCSVGYRSEKVVGKLLAAGFTNVSNLVGGIFEWVNQGHPVVDLAGQPTENVHAYDRVWGVWLRRGKAVYD